MNIIVKHEENRCKEAAGKLVSLGDNSMDMRIHDVMRQARRKEADGMTYGHATRWAANELEAMLERRRNGNS